MSDDVTRPRPPAGWLMDSTTGLVRWWDGSRWTEHIRPDSLTGSHAVPVSPDAVAMEAPVAIAPVVAEPVTPEAEPGVPEPAGPGVPEPAGPGVPEPAGPPTRASLRASRRAVAGAEEPAPAPVAEEPTAPDPAPEEPVAEVPVAPAATEPAAPEPAAPLETPAPAPPAPTAPAWEAAVADSSATPPPVSATRVRAATRYGLRAESQTSPPAQPLLPPSEPLTSKNGPAKASLILILLLALGVGAVALLTGMDAAVVAVVTALNVVMAIAAFGLAIVGLFIAIRRPTKKRESVFALVVSSLFIVYLAVTVYLRLTSTGA